MVGVRLVRTVVTGSSFAGSSFSLLGSLAHRLLAHRLDFPISNSTHLRSSRYQVF